MDKKLLLTATSSDQSPTPGYILSEITRKKPSFYEPVMTQKILLDSGLKTFFHNLIDRSHFDELYSFCAARGIFDLKN